MVELSSKEKEVLDFLLEFIEMGIFSIEQHERDLGRLDYSLCSDDSEKQLITEKKIAKLKKRLSKCNPIIAGYINALTTSDPLNSSHEEKLLMISKNFLLTEYSELFEMLVSEDISTIQGYQFESIIKSLGFKYKPLKEFIQAVCDVNSFYLYKSFLEISQNDNLSYEKVKDKLNNAFFRLEAFMNGTVNQYVHFDFNTTFTELFYCTRKLENVSYANYNLIGEYWGLTEQIRVDYDKSTFDNHKAYENKAFCNDCNVISSIAWDRISEFNSFATPDEIEEQNRKKSISDVIKASDKVEAVKEEIKNLIVETPTEESNLYPRIFTSDKAFHKFKNLVEAFGNGDEKLADYSFVFHRMRKDKLIYDDYQQTQFVYFLLEFNINISRIKPKTQLGKSDLRESIYNRV
ncbi:hypothetical protein [Flavobacterium ovatum]|uniref:hypothetical protein n=1 Tax=Flavobacterium ovatum TaxID=1928857 RepID=UPI00344C7329